LGQSSNPKKTTYVLCDLEEAAALQTFTFLSIEAIQMIKYVRQGFLSTHPSLVCYKLSLHLPLPGSLEKYPHSSLLPGNTGTSAGSHTLLVWSHIRELCLKEKLLVPSQLL
jgi:hypothetical protein